MTASKFGVVLGSGIIGISVFGLFTYCLGVPYPLLAQAMAAISSMILAYKYL